MFEVSNPINWLDAQSSCAIWGGDLASITTVRENNYLNTLIISSVGNYWIGLNDRDVEGMYTWIDGATVSYINWASTPSDDTNSNCVQINNAGNDIWESVSCDATLNAFLCKRDESNTIPQGLLYLCTLGCISCLLYCLVALRRLRTRVACGAGRPAGPRAARGLARGCGPSIIISLRALRAEFFCCGP